MLAQSTLDAGVDKPFLGSYNYLFWKPELRDHR